LSKERARADESCGASRSSTQHMYPSKSATWPPHWLSRDPRIVHDGERRG
jgi:hypothetical protein